MDVRAIAYVMGMTDRVALLLRRAGFGPTAGELDVARRDGAEATAARMTARAVRDHDSHDLSILDLGPDADSFLPDNPQPADRTTALKLRKQQSDLLLRWWLDRMVIAGDQVGEKLVFFWHGHWATALKKVSSPQMMLRQQRVFREAADFAAMSRAMVTDPALLYWLDGHLNSKDAPNENFARELMELFMLGIGNYSERDVKEAGRALTGYWVDFVHTRSVFNKDAHDGSKKTILGKTSGFSPAELINHFLSRRACPEFIAARLWFRFASSTTPPPPDVKARMVAAFPDPRAMLRALFLHEAFAATAGTMVKQPVEWFAGALRQLSVRPKDFSDSVFAHMYSGLNRMGQLPLQPPSVGGWPHGIAWLTPAAAQARLDVASKLAELTDVGVRTPDDLARVLAVDIWTNRTFAALKGVKDVRQMLTLGLCSPEYLVS